MKPYFENMERFGKELKQGRIKRAAESSAKLRQTEEKIEQRHTETLEAMAREPDRRYQDASDFAEDLGRYRRREPINARPVGPAERAVRWCRRNKAVSSLAAGIAAGIAAIA